MKSPNFIFLLIDDLGWRDLSCYGSDFYETPHLDRLAAEGMRFHNAYAACPVCSPTRASILTGRYPATLGITNYIAIHDEHPAYGKLIDAPYIDHLPLEETSLATALKAGGYATWHVGKWHLGSEPYYPEKHGFDVNIGGCHWGHPAGGYFSPYGNPKLADGPEGEYLIDRLTDEAIQLIEQHDEQPFFINLWYYAVHTPIQAKPEHIEKFQAKAQQMGLEMLDPFEIGEPFPTEHKKHLHIIHRVVQSDPAYAAMVYSLDENIGRLLDALERTGKAENTVIIFHSDNGGLATAEGSPTCNAPLAEGKGWMYEGGTRVPLIICWPGVIKPGTTCQVPVTSPDFYPTLLEIAGLPQRPQQHTDGLSLLPLLQESEFSDREAIFWHYPHYGNQGGTPGASLRAGDYKLIRFFEEDQIELYNLQQDISEERNLATEMPGLAADLQARLSDWLQQVEAKFPQRSPAAPPERPEEASR